MRSAMSSAASCSFCQVLPDAANPSLAWLSPACRGMLGYVHRERGVPLDALSFSQLLPSSEREGVSVVFDYILWLHAARNISVNTEGLVVSGGWRSLWA